MAHHNQIRKDCQRRESNPNLPITSLNHWIILFRCLVIPLPFAASSMIADHKSGILECHFQSLYHVILQDQYHYIYQALCEALETDDFYYSAPQFQDNYAAWSEQGLLETQFEVLLYNYMYVFVIFNYNCLSQDLSSCPLEWVLFLTTTTKYSNHSKEQTA